MLTITPQASEALRGVLAAPEVPDGSVVRICPQPDARLAVSVAEAPEPDDQIVSGGDVQVCVEASAAPLLADKELDVDVIDDEITFSVAEQVGAAEPANDAEPPNGAARAG